jgi:hypothetical protein
MPGAAEQVCRSNGEQHTEDDPFVGAFRNTHVL